MTSRIRKPSRVLRTAGRSNAQPTGTETEEDLIVEEPAAPPALEIDPDGGTRVDRPSARRRTSGGRASRRTSATSSGGMASRSSRREKTPEQQNASRRAVMLVFKIIFTIVLIAGGAFALFWFKIRETPEEKTARSALTLAEAKIRALEQSLQNGEPKPAWDAFNEALIGLDIPELAHAEQNPNPEAPGLANISLAIKAYDLRTHLEKVLQAKIERCERDKNADTNARQLDQALSQLEKLDDVGLVDLDKQIAGFLGNPVDPTAGRHEVYIKDYPTLLAQINTQKFRVGREIESRRTSTTSLQEQNAHREADGFVKEEKFKDGLSMIAKYRDQYKDANFDQVEAFVKASAEKAWESAKTYSDNNYKTFVAPGTSEDIRAEALVNANRRMQEVIDRFGLEEYTSQAATAMNEYKR
jgi:hypothetical protein